MTRFIEINARIIFALLVTVALAAITVNLYTLRKSVEKRQQPANFPSVQELKSAWPEGYELFKVGALTSEEFVKEAWSRTPEGQAR